MQQAKQHMCADTALGCVKRQIVANLGAVFELMLGCAQNRKQFRFRSRINKAIGACKWVNGQQAFAHHSGPMGRRLLTGSNASRGRWAGTSKTALTVAPCSRSATPP